MGWFPVIDSEDLEPGSIKAAHFFDKELVLWRDESGEPHVMGAFCPHMGAHVAHGGMVEGDAIRCPFHGWRFAGDGRCRAIPYSQRIPRVSLRNYPTVDRNGQVIAWYHPKHESPLWDIPTIPEWVNTKSTITSKIERVIATTWQEVSENGVDFAHFPAVHMAQPVKHFEINCDGPFRRVLRRQKIVTPVGYVDSEITSEEFGPGVGVVRFDVAFTHLDLTSFCIITGVTPIDQESVFVRFALALSGEAGARNRGIGRLLLRDLMRQLDQDITIWEHKRYTGAPRIVEGDGPILAHRHWASQFYPSVPGQQG